MALKKQVRKPNGLVLDYHRIAMVKIDTNQQITILLYSYLNEEARNYEKAYAAGEIEGEPTFPYVDHEYIALDYDESMNITNAYEWLKTRPEFVGAEDI
jgi:hypothetical protein